MKGETVIVRAYGNEPQALKVWDADTEHVCVCDDAVYRELQSGTSERNPIGFFREDVFTYNENLFREVLREYKTKPSVWNRLKVWRGNDKSEPEREETKTRTKQTRLALATHI